jgi:hypothetical protein
MLKLAKVEYHPLPFTSPEGFCSTPSPTSNIVNDQKVIPIAAEEPFDFVKRAKNGQHQHNEQ